jgi:hypothetical protein
MIIDTRDNEMIDWKRVVLAESEMYEKMELTSFNLARPIITGLYLAWLVFSGYHPGQIFQPHRTSWPYKAVTF